MRGGGNLSSVLNPASLSLHWASNSPLCGTIRNTNVCRHSAFERCPTTSSIWPMPFGEFLKRQRGCPGFKHKHRTQDSFTIASGVKFVDRHLYILRIGWLRVKAPICMLAVRHCRPMLRWPHSLSARSTKSPHGRDCRRKPAVNTQFRNLWPVVRSYMAFRRWEISGYRG